MSTPRSATDVRAAVAGTTITSGPRRSGFAEWNRFAAVNDEFVPLHMDDAEGHRAGYPGAIAMGRLQWSYAHNLLRDWLGGHGRVLAVELRYRSPLLKDALFEVKATVTAARHEDGKKLLDLQLVIEDADETLLASGPAVLILFEDN